MSPWFPILAALLLSVPSDAGIADAAKKLADSISSNVAAVTDPLAKAAVFIGFSQCKHVKRILGVSYDEDDEPDMSKLELVHFTKEANYTYNLSTLDSLDTLESFNPKIGLVIYIHGFTDNPTKESYTTMNNAFFNLMDFNIFSLDASSLIRWLYLRSSTMVRYIGEKLGHVLAKLIATGLDHSNIHLIGHSLGAHIAGFTGKQVIELTGKQVARISGLDPAGPCFADVGSSIKLNKTDAEYVDVIHSDAGVYGLNEVIGHTDYYPNSGSDQNGCLMQTCSHSRAWQYYAESVQNLTAFPAIKCESWQAFRNGDCNNTDISFMGYPSVEGTTGLYFLQTNAESPYGQGVDGIIHDNNEAFLKKLFIGISG